MWPLVTNAYKDVYPLFTTKVGQLQGMFVFQYSYSMVFNLVDIIFAGCVKFLIHDNYACTNTYAQSVLPETLINKREHTRWKGFLENTTNSADSLLLYFDSKDQYYILIA